MAGSAKNMEAMCMVYGGDFMLSKRIIRRMAIGMLLMIMLVSACTQSDTGENRENDAAETAVPAGADPCLRNYPQVISDLRKEDSEESKRRYSWRRSTRH